jgi:hypothetical protein
MAPVFIIAHSEGLRLQGFTREKYLLKEWNADKQRFGRRKRAMTKPTMCWMRLRLLRPLLLPATKLTLRKARQLLEGSQVRSHFGGRPYFEVGEAWPTTKTGQPLNFIMQVLASDEAILPAGIALMQLFYSWEAFSWDTEEEG